MKLKHIEVDNYRNLQNLVVDFNDSCNFIVGENNLGKSNLLQLLRTLFTAKTFRREDFKDSSKPIEVSFTLQLASVELGQFEDYFDITDPEKITIKAIQEDSDDYINYTHADSGAYIPVAAVRNLNFVHYDSLRNPITEITFDKGKGVGRFLKEIISQFVEKKSITGADCLNPAQITALVTSINSTISKIKAFKDFGITAAPEDNLDELLMRVLTLKDAKGDLLSNAGYGVQFLVLVTLSILERLQNIKHQRGDRGVYQDALTGRKSLSLVLGLDEPEIHLHPYMQRSLVKYLNSIIAGTNDDFNLLVKEMFDIDDFHGQVIIATHSPNVLLDNYKQIIRFIEREGKVIAICGENITLDNSLHKHLQAQFPLIKEAFFSRCVIFVEGPTEVGCFPRWATTVGISLDDLGICVIYVGGSNSVPKFIDLASKFDIRCYGITDKDDNTAPLPSANQFETTLRDFEAELVANLDWGNEVVLRQIAVAYDPNAESDPRQEAQLNKYAAKYGLPSVSGPIKLEDIPLTDIELLRLFYLTWFQGNKTIVLGMLIGEHLQVDQIPQVYKQLLLDAKTLAEAP